jgi:hypothetical protein
MPWYVLPRTDGQRIFLEAERPDLETVEPPSPEKPVGKKPAPKPVGEDE